eukprot:2146135-Pyramimonas_sp.AAC.1
MAYVRAALAYWVPPCAFWPVGFFPGHLLSAGGAQLGLGFQQASAMEMVLLLLEVDLAPDLGILGPPLLEAFDPGRTKVFPGGLGAPKSSSSFSSCVIN